MKVIGTAGVYLLISLSYLCSNILGPGERDAHAQNVCFCLISISLLGCVHNCKTTDLLRDGQDGFRKARAGMY